MVFPKQLVLSLCLAQAALARVNAFAGTVQGFDISHYQANVNFQAAYDAGSRFVIIKATEGTTIKDPKYNDHTTRAADVGFIHGAYHFARPTSGSGKAQALFFLANGGSWTADGLTLPGMLDIENNPTASGPQCYGLSQSQMVDWIRDFVDTYSGTTGRFPMIYTTNNFWTTCTGNYRAFANYCPLVLARYSSSPGPVPGGWPSYTIWQNSDSFQFGGDSDIFNGDEAALLGLASGMNAAKAYSARPLLDVVGQKVILTDTEHLHPFYINFTIGPSDGMHSSVDDPWTESRSVTFRDGSVSLLCVCAGNSHATMTVVPWRIANVITANNAYLRHGTRPDTTTGGVVDFYAGIGAGEYI